MPQRKTLPDNVSKKNMRKRNSKKEKSGGSPEEHPSCLPGSSEGLIANNSQWVVTSDMDVDITPDGPCPHIDSYRNGQEKDGDYITEQRQYIQTDTTWSTVTSLEEVNGVSIVGAKTLQVDSSKLHPRWSRINESQGGIPNSHVDDVSFVEKHRQKSGSKAQKVPWRRARTCGGTTKEESRKRAQTLLWRMTKFSLHFAR